MSLGPKHTFKAFVSVRIAHGLSSAVLHPACENRTGFFAHEVTGHRDLDWGVRSDKGHKGVVDLYFVLPRTCEVVRMSMFLYTQQCSSAGRPKDRKYCSPTVVAAILEEWISCRGREADMSWLLRARCLCEDLEEFYD
jgi:hypothetical protein